MTFADESYPNVELKTGDLSWTIRSRIISGGAFGNIGTISCPWPYNFGVYLGAGYSDPGAEDVKAILLDPQGTGSDNNYSNILGGAIRGDLLGNGSTGMTLQKSSGGTGGELTLYIDEQLQDDINVPRIQSLQLFGGSSSGGSVTADEILYLGQLAYGNGAAPDCGTTLVQGAISIGTMREYSTIYTHGDLAANLTVTTAMEPSADIILRGSVGDVDITLPDIQSGGSRDSVLQFGFASDVCVFNGDLFLDSGVNADTDFDMYASLGASGSIDLDGAGVANPMLITRGGSGTIVDGGAISNTVTLSSVSGTSFTGSATFASVSSTGRIETTNSTDLGGSLTITGNMDGDIVVDDDLSASIDIGGSMASTGLIDVGDDQSGAIEATGSVAGDILVGDELSGNIDIRSNLSSGGLIDVEGNQLSDITIGGAVADGAVINVGEMGNCVFCSGTAEIIVTGLMDGQIDVDGSTWVVSLILLTGGIDDNGVVTINADQGNNNANGDIYVGTTDVTPPLQNVIYDGCIHVFDDSGDSSDGDLNGDITVVGCHATNANLGIVIDGATNGTITITQTSCANTVAQGACP